MRLYACKGWEGGCILRVRDALSELVKSARRDVAIKGRDTGFRGCFGEPRNLMAKRFREAACALYRELWCQWSGNPREAQGDGRPVRYLIDDNLHVDMVIALTRISMIFGQQMEFWQWDEDGWRRAGLQGEDPLVFQISGHDFDALEYCLSELDGAIFLHPEPKNPRRTPLFTILDRGRDLHKWMINRMPLVSTSWDDEMGLIRDVTRPVANARTYAWDLLFLRTMTKISGFRGEVLGADWDRSVLDEEIAERSILNAVDALFHAIDTMEIDSWGYPEGLPREDLDEFAAALNGLRDIACDNTPWPQEAVGDGEDFGETTQPLPYAPTPKTLGRSSHSNEKINGFPPIAELPPPVVQLSVTGSRPSATHAPAIHSDVQESLDLTVLILGDQGEKFYIGAKEKSALTRGEYEVIRALIRAGKEGLKGEDLEANSGIKSAVKVLKRLAKKDPDWGDIIILAGRPHGRYRLRCLEMSSKVQESPEKSRNFRQNDQENDQESPPHRP